MSKSYPDKFVIKEKSYKDYINIIFRMYLSELQLIEHLEIDLLNEVPRKIDGADPGNSTEGSTTHVVDLIVTQIQPPEKTHSAESVRIEFSDLVVAQIQDL